MLLSCRLYSHVLHTQENADIEPLRTTFELNDTLWADATVEEGDEVYLWLGVRQSPPLSPLLPATIGIH